MPRTSSVPSRHPAPGIEFDHVWKKFRRGERHDSLRDLLPAVARRLTGRSIPKDQLRENDFWALSDVSFQVRPGEVLGVIGRNGAGKSTVLKALTRIIPPTRGRCEVRGRVGALIEVAAGFHQDLTGRENVFLQGAIMGMPKAMIRERFDDIVEFAGVGPFIDTQVKRYSSGMNARLGFSIAAYLNPDVLIIDEVLAVGDHEFQTRAFGRVSALATSGIPVVVVSHQLDRVAELCTHGIFLERGRVAKQGTISECISTYLSVGERAGEGVSAVRLEHLHFHGTEAVPSGGTLRAELLGRVDGATATHKETVLISVRNLQDGKTFSSFGLDLFDVALPDDGEFTVAIELQLNVPAGLYGIEAVVWDREQHREIASGPGAHVLVEKGSPFYGVAQTNPRIEICQPSSVP